MTVRVECPGSERSLNSQRGKTSRSTFGVAKDRIPELNPSLTDHRSSGYGYQFSDARHRRVGDEIQLVIEATRDVAQGGGYPGTGAELTNSVAGRVQESMQSNPSVSSGRYMVVGGSGGYPVHVEPGRNSGYSGAVVGAHLSANSTRQFMLRIGAGLDKPSSELCTVLATRDYLGLLGLVIRSLPVGTPGPLTSVTAIGAESFVLAAKTVYTYRGSGSSGTDIRNLRDRRLYAAETCDSADTAVLYFLFS